MGALFRRKTGDMGRGLPSLPLLSPLAMSGSRGLKFRISPERELPAASAPVPLRRGSFSTERMVLTGEICFGLKVFLREENEGVERPVVS